MQPQPQMQPQPWHGQGQGQPSMLASHAERERAVDVLRAGYGEGRLEHAEFEKRVARAYEARTVGELALLVADLPQGPVPAGQGVPATFLPPPPVTNGKAVGALVCGVLTVATAGLSGVPAVILGHAARAEMRRSGERGEGLAMTGLVLGWLSVAGWVFFVLLLVVAGLVSAG
ncbi:DUF1707 and DUF4190 domain-containing protein [Streptomyces sp. enrichment culture]|uniref:DUF1707 and DUF4190 domain-containing protein n=1 Tax=Streptomyces sp. enrichment culture TaxID=1795815 RepID=UPI003F560F57